MNKLEKSLLLVRKHFKETSDEELRKEFDNFHSPNSQDITIEEYFANFAENHGFLQDLERKSNLNTQTVFEDEGQHELQYENVLPPDKIMATQVETNIAKKNVTYSQTMYCSAA